jgi:quercetin dioxygenase-like cupin family protein
MLDIMVGLSVEQIEETTRMDHRPMTTSGQSGSMVLATGPCRPRHSLPRAIFLTTAAVLILAGASCAGPSLKVAGVSSSPRIGSPQIGSAGTGPLVTGTVLGEGIATGKFAITTKGTSDVVVQQVTIQPGGRTGWHTHAGKVIVVVKAGTVTRYTADCKAVTYTAGHAFIETQGVHEGRNEGTVPVELYVTYIDPAGRPLKDEATSPACGR